MFTVYASTCTAFSFAGCKEIRETLLAGINTATSIALIVAAIFMVIGAIKFITSSGDKGKADEAKNLLTNVLIGIAVILSINIFFGVVTSLFSGGGDFSIPTVGKVVTSN